MIGDVVTIRGKEKVKSVYNSMCHGTGRTMSRSAAKVQSSSYDYDTLRNKIYIPEVIKNESIKTDAPYCYRDLDDCLLLIDDLVEVENRFKPIALSRSNLGFKKRFAQQSAKRQPGLGKLTLVNFELCPVSSRRQ